MFTNDSFHFKNLKYEKVYISPCDISAAHRLSTKSSSQRAPRQDIIVKFYRRETKLDVLMKFFVNVLLTPARQTISYVLLKAKKDFRRLISKSTYFLKK